MGYIVDVVLPPALAFIMLALGPGFARIEQITVVAGLAEQRLVAARGTLFRVGDDRLPIGPVLLRLRLVAAPRVTLMALHRPDRLEGACRGKPPRIPDGRYPPPPP